MLDVSIRDTTPQNSQPGFFCLQENSPVVVLSFRGNPERVFFLAAKPSLKVGLLFFEQKVGEKILGNRYLLHVSKSPNV